MSLESLCLPYMTSARVLASLDDGHLVHEGARVEVDGQTVLQVWSNLRSIV